MDKKALLLFGVVLLCLMFTACPAGMEDYGVHPPWGTKTGTATESALGYQGMPVTVTLTMSGGIITDVVIDASLQTPQYGGKAAELAKPLILARNSFEIDALSAPSTTRAIKEAGEAAIDAIP